MPPAAKPLRVLFLPDFSASNPYQRQLAEGLRVLGITVTMARAPRRQPLPILREWLRHGRPDVIHLHWTHNYLGGTAVPGRAAAPGRLARARFLWQLRIVKALGTRLVWTVHNLGVHDGAGDPREMSVHRQLVGLCDAVICHCEAALEAAVDAYDLRSADRARLHVIPHGNYVGLYPAPADRAEARARLELTEDVTVLAFVGAIRAYKGVAQLLAAFHEIDDPKARLIVAGNPRATRDAPGLGSELAAAARRDPRVQVRLRFVPDEEIGILLTAADAVVLPFRDILTSGSAILAMSFGKAVVAPRLGCLPELLDTGGGLLYDPVPADALRNALRAALAADLPAIGARNLDRARQLDWGRIAAATAQLYRGDG